MRRALFLLIGFMPLVASAQDIDFVAKGEPLKRVVERLSELHAQTLYVSPDIQNEILVVDVDGVEIQELVDKVAEVVSAKWTLGASNSLRLERTPQKANELREASVARRATEVKEYLKQFDKTLATPFTADDAVSVRQEIEAFGARMKANPRDPSAGFGVNGAYAKGPQSRLLHRLLRTIDPALLVDIEFGERRVFNLTPTVLQYGFGNGAKEAFEKYVVEQNVWAAVAAGNNTQLNYASNPLNHTSAVSEPPYEWSIVLAKGEAATPLFANLVAWRPDGGNTTMFQVMPPDARVVALGPFFESQPSIPDDMTGLERELAEVALDRRLRLAKVVNDEGREFVMKPTEGDVGGLIASYALSKRHPAKDIVAVIPDEALYVVAFFLSSFDDVERFDLAMTDGLNLKSETDGDWLLYYSLDPYLTTHERTPRVELEKYLGDTVKIGRDTLLNYSKVAAKTSRPSFLVMALSSYVGLPSSGMYSVQRSWNSVKMYGLLAPTQRTALEQGQALKYAALTKNQREAFLRMAVSRLIDSRHNTPGGKGFRTFGRSVEPTEWLAKGIPGDAELTMDFKDEPVVFGYQKSGDGFKVFSAFYPRAVAMYENAKNNPGTFPSTVVMPDAWAMGVRRSMNFKLQYSEQRWQLFPLTEDATDPDAKPGPWQSLPKEIADEIRKQMGGRERRHQPA